ncbi:hypothetical protein [Bartonella bovis]|uniref:hypothetical protein n=1 Tax=Bartonella bovis TaxID=155194 RepID=UPI001FCE3D92|nr:hypothetical protein [Bartonella bovis]
MSIEKKYELSEEGTLFIRYDSNGLYYCILHQIKALKDFGDVKAGDLGGYVEKEDNLSHEGDCWVDDEARVYKNAKVYGNAYVYGDALVHGNARVHGDARVYKNAQIFGNADISSGEWGRDCIINNTTETDTSASTQCEHNR